jgi:hypothetical protein
MTEKKFEKVVVKDLIQLKMVMKPFMSADGKEVELTTEMTWHEDNKSIKTNVMAKSRELSPRQVLLDGFELIKKRMDLAEQAKNDVDDDDDLLPERIKWDLFDINSQKFHVDMFIEQRLDGKRNGLRIEWNITEGVFQYDPFENKLYKVE